MGYLLYGYEWDKSNLAKAVADAYLFIFVAGTYVLISVVGTLVIRKPSFPGKLLLETFMLFVLHIAIASTIVSAFVLAGNTYHAH